MSDPAPGFSPPYTYSGEPTLGAKMDDVSRSSTLFSLGGVDDRCFSTIQEETLAIPEGWTMCVHPQGWVYFYNHTLKVVADHNIRLPGILEITRQSYLGYPLSELTEGMEVHLHVQAQKIADKFKGNNGGIATFNLTINHKHCVASYEIADVMGDNSCLLGPQRLNRCRRLYWNYLWNHPSHVTTPPRAIEDAFDSLTWFYTDNLISGQRSTVPFSKLECEELSRVVKEISRPENEKSIAKTVFLAWLLREVCSYRDAENWGQLTQKESQAFRREKLAPSHAAYQPPPVLLGILMFVINVLCFGIPHTYRAHVKMTSEYRGRLSSVQKNWENYIERLVREYSHFLLISTVLLSATVGFLAVEGIPEGAQVSATISTFASLGSIIVGVFSIWRHQANTSTADSFTYMHNVQHRYLGLYGHAIMLSLPPTLLVWAILTFTVSVVVYVMHGVNASEGTWGKISTWTVLAIFIILFMAVLLALYTFSIIWKFQRRSVKIWYRICSIWSNTASVMGRGPQPKPRDIVRV
ncbi:hypothetical protein JR316_0004488 [Psilocybe cubensis]|uniref:Uncharacterized protein n=2 Tax=Psilocybe cubensis TaxID=181762 RepID=A0ACB8H324_PSICU|nr:hypothetical protein JR316_0004488 [Psilocybe cubensis]KAH9482388.1 hypothetical protein JR316_0004488 [Psilocybe cubensis]